MQSLTRRSLFQGFVGLLGLGGMRTRGAEAHTPPFPTDGLHPTMAGVIAVQHKVAAKREHCDRIMGYAETVFLHRLQELLDEVGRDRLELLVYRQCDDPRCHDWSFDIHSLESFRHVGRGVLWVPDRVLPVTPPEVDAFTRRLRKEGQGVLAGTRRVTPEEFAAANRIWPVWEDA